MNLADKVDIWGTGPDELDEYGDPKPGQPMKLATVPAHVYWQTSTVSLEVGKANLTDELKCIIAPYEIDPKRHTIVWRSDRYNIAGRLIRSAQGQTHHLTLSLKLVS